MILIGGKHITNPISKIGILMKCNPQVNRHGRLHPISSNIDQYIMEDEVDDQETEYEVEQLKTHANEIKGTEEENCDALMVDSDVVEDHIALYDGKYEDEDQ